MALKLPDSAVPMGDFPVAKAVDIDFNDGENLQEKLDNGKLGSGGNTTDLTDINNKLSELENNQIKKLYVNRLDNNIAGIIKIIPNGINTFSKILITDVYGVCILITGAKNGDSSVKSFKVVKISNGSWLTNSPSVNSLNKLLNIYYDGSYIYLEVGNYSNLYFEGGFSSVETIDSLPTDVTVLPILDLTQTVTTAITNVLDNNSTIHQVPNAKLVAGEIHGKVVNLADYSDALKIPIGKWRVDSTDKAKQMQNLPVSEAGILEVKYLHGNDGTTVYTSPFRYAMLTYTVINGDKYERAISSDGTAGNITRDTGWRKIINGNSSELTNINTKLIQLENTINEVGGGGIYQSGEIEVGTWTGGQKLYRYTISDNTERTFSNGTMMLDFFTLSRDKYAVVKLDGTFRMCAAHDNSGAHTVYALPYVDLDTNRQVQLVYTTQDRVRLSGRNLTDYKILGFDVSIYYYKK